LLAPVGGIGMAHADGDIEVAHGARMSGHQMVLSTAATFGIEDVAAARGAPVWYQLYATDQWPVTQGMLRRVERAGSKVLLLTVDIPARNQDRMRRFNTTDEDCQLCHDPSASFADKAMLKGLDIQPGLNVTNPSMDWDFVKRLKDSTSMH